MASYGRAGGDWRLTLQPGEAESAARRLFVGRLNWLDEGLGRNGPIQVVAGTPDPMQIGVSGEGDDLLLNWNIGGYEVAFRINRDSPSAQQIRLLERLVRDEQSDEASAVVRGVFDCERLALDFSLGAAEIVQKHAHGAESFLVQISLRLIFLKMLESRGWARFHAKGGYVRELWEDHKKRPEPYSFSQRLALAWESAMRQPDPEPRTLLQAQIGHPPYLGPELLPPLADPEHPPKEPAPEFYEEFVAWLDHFDFCLDEPGAERASLAIAPDSLARFAASALDMAGPKSSRGMRVAARGAVLASQRKLTHLHAVEIPCGWGDHLSATLAEISQFVEPRLVLRSQVRGVTEDAVELSVCRLRLLAACLAGDRDEAPRPVDGLDGAVRFGFALRAEDVAMREADDFIPAESPTVEHRPWLGEEDAESLLRSIAGFLNASGGLILLGVDESGATAEAGEEHSTMAEWISHSCASRLSPPPGPLLRVRPHPHPAGGLLRVEVSPSYAPVALQTRHPKTGETTEQFFVRQVNVHRELTGQAKERFVRERK